MVYLFIFMYLIIIIWKHQGIIFCMVAKCTWKLSGQIIATYQTWPRMGTVLRYQMLWYQVSCKNHIHTTNLSLARWICGLPLLCRQEKNNCNHGKNGTTIDVICRRYYKIWLISCDEQSRRTKKPVKLRLFHHYYQVDA